MGFKHLGRQDSGLQCGIACFARKTADGVLLNCATPLYSALEDAGSMEAVVKALLLLAKVHKGQANSQAFMQTQMEARERQLRLVNRLRGEPELARVQKEAAADICFTLAQEYDAGLNRNYEQVREHAA